MKLTLNNHVTKTPLPITLTPAMKEIFDTLTAKGMKPLIVGGAVRDAVIKGSDILTRLNLTEGPEVGKMLDKAWQAQRMGAFVMRPEALAWLDQQTPSTSEVDTE